MTTTGPASCDSARRPHRRVRRRPWTRRRPHAPARRRRRRARGAPLDRRRPADRHPGAELVGIGLLPAHRRRGSPTSRRAAHVVSRAVRPRARLVVHLAAHGPRNLLHVSVFVACMSPSDLSSREATIVEAGPDAAVDGRMFGALLLRFGRVDAERAVLSLDGEVEGIESGSEARSQVAADISCSVEAGEVPSYCQRCGAPLAGEARAVGQMIGGRHVELRRPLPSAGPAPPSRASCRRCAARSAPRRTSRTRSPGSPTSSRSPTPARASTDTRCRVSARAPRRT